MNDLEKTLLDEETGGAAPRLCIRTGTRIDAGRWWRRVPVWLCMVGDELLLLAVARRRHVERMAIADCHASHYSHATGELVIEPSESLRINRFSLTPREALQVLNFLKKDYQQPITETKT
jgi:hypothetical protein